MPLKLNVADVIRAPKFSPEIGEWKSGHIPRAQFPLSRVKPKSYKFGPDYRWRIARFETSLGKYRVLVLLNESKAIFRATLASETPTGDLVVLCQHEYHQSEPGWHCHVSFADIDLMPHGVFRSHLDRWPKYKSNSEARHGFNVEEKNALSIAANVFRFRAQGDLI